MNEKSSFCHFSNLRNIGYFFPLNVGKHGSDRIPIILQMMHIKGFIKLFAAINSNLESRSTWRKSQLHYVQNCKS